MMNTRSAKYCEDKLIFKIKSYRSHVNSRSSCSHGRCLLCIMSCRVEQKE